MNLSETINYLFVTLPHLFVIFTICCVNFLRNNWVVTNLHLKCRFDDGENWSRGSGLDFLPPVIPIDELWNHSVPEPICYL